MPQDTSALALRAAAAGILLSRAVFYLSTHGVEA
jgi:hypothetical protein